MMAEPLANRLLNTQLDLENEFRLPFFLVSSVFLVFVGGVAGLIPSLVISHFSPVEVVKGSLRKKTKNIYSKILISFQYIVAICLLICTWMIIRQTLFLQNYDTGFNRENMIRATNEIPNEKKAAFKDLVEGIAGVERLAYTAGSPVDGGNNQSWTHQGKPVSFQEFMVDSAFLELMDFEIVPTGAAYDSKGMYLNETAVKELELDPLPTSFKRYDEEIPVLGIIKDFHFRSLYEPIGPAMIGQLTENRWAWAIFVKTDGLNDVNTIRKVTEAYMEFTGGIPMKYRYVDDTIRSWYEKEENTAKIIGYFSLLAIILSIMGVFAMSSYFIQQRIKDIGIRKVNGAQSGQILRMLSMDFLKWVLLAFLIAVPVSWYAIQKWMQRFAYKIDTPWWIFIACGVLVVLIAFTSVAWQSWRAASRNPSESLRYE
jgi:putative ABC transport system permease protein